MNNLTLLLLSAVILNAITFSSSVLSQTKITIVDQNNNPLPNTVIEFVASNSISQQPAATQSDQLYVMDQVNKSFVPHVLVVPTNSLVSFPNSDDIRHHVYSFSPAKTFELKLYAGKPKNPVRFDQNGVVVMGCNIHDSMVGYIYVSEKESSYLTDIEGAAMLPTNLAVNTQLQVWHPNSEKGVSAHTIFTVEQSMLSDNQVTLILPVNSPAPRDSFETLVFDEL